MGAMCFALIDNSQAVLSYTLSTAFYVSGGEPVAGEIPPPRRAVRRKYEGWP